MTENPIYLLDANVFIEAARRYYAFDLGTRFWEILERLSKDGRIQSIDRVLRPELERGKDELAKWAFSHLENAFASTNEPEVSREYGNIMAWVQSSKQFFDYAKADFARGADGWLVAYALVHHCKVVTHETFKPEVKNKVPIPNVCRNFKVTWVDTFQMLRELKVRLS